MASLLIKNFGPICAGFDEGYFKISRLSVLLGEQGTGKSTVAKIFSVFTWLEKSFVREYYTDFSLKDFIDLCSYQRLPAEYFEETTELGYQGGAFSFHIKSNTFSFEKNASGSYVCPKIMYVPSERNVVSVLQNVDEIKNFPDILKDFKLELKKANLVMTGNIDTFMPDYKVSYDRSEDLNYIQYVGKNVRIPITKASSGLQSSVPLFLVTNNLLRELKKSILQRIDDMSIANKELVLKTLEGTSVYSKLRLYLDSKIKRNFSQEDIIELDSKISCYVNSTFVNIVEEPEQNLFPMTQIKVLEELLKNNHIAKGLLFITTHSPYILSALNNYIYADEVYKSKGAMIDEIPESLFIDIDEVSAYKVEDGRIFSIKDEECGLIDSSAIDSCSSQINMTYEKLMNVGERA